MLNIYNAALAMLGGNRPELLAEADEPGTPGSLCRLLLPQVLDLALDYAPWSFALARVRLTADPAGRGSGRHPHAFTLPEDLIRPVRLGAEEPGHPFAIEGTKLFAPLPEAELIYVRRVEDPAGWTAPFTRAVVLGLAAELCPALLNDVSRQEYYRQECLAALAYAAAADLKRQKFLPRPGAWLESRDR